MVARISMTVAGMIFATFLSIQNNALAQGKFNVLPKKPVLIDMWASPLPMKLSNLLSITLDQLASEQRRSQENAGEIYYEAVATIGSTDKQATTILQLLAKNNIDYLMGGSRALSISVHPNDAKRARALLVAMQDEGSVNLNILKAKTESR